MKNLPKKTRFAFSSIWLISLSLIFSVAIGSFANAYNNPNLVLPPSNSPQTSSTGIEGTIPSPAPTSAASIGIPTGGQVFSSEPITVSGVCTGSLLIELFDNGVFSGSNQCSNNSYSITTYLFTGSNTLVAKDFDALNQEGPDSNSVTVTYNSPAGSSLVGITLTSNYARLGQDPGSELTWPIIISNGTTPYAIDVSWGDGSSDDLLSQPTSGQFNINHVYKVAGVYTILVRATDSANNTAYLQLTAVANGKINQATLATSTKNTKAPKSGVVLKSSTIWTLAIIAVLISPLAFWLGLRHQLKVVRRKLEQGERPFK